MFFIISVIVLILLSLAGNFIFYLSASKQLRKNRIFRTIWGIETIGVALLPVILVSLTFYTGLSTDSRIFMWGVFLTLLFIVPLICFMIYALVAVFPFNQRIRRVTAGIGWLMMGIIASAILYGGIVGRKKIVVEKEVIYTSRLPESFDKLKIVQISDLHLGSIRHNPEYIQAIVDSVNNQHPDLIFFTGDLVNSKASEAEPFRSLLHSLKAKEGVYSVLGNHDYAYYHRWNSEEERLNNVAQLIALEKKAGWDLLNNEHRILSRNGDSIVIAGVENWGEKRFGQQGDLGKALTNISDSSFILLLSHNPVHWRKEVLPETNVDVTFSGHTHAMQMQIGNFSPSEWLYKEWSGLYQENNQYLYVNRGTGFVIFPARIGAYPEISFIELRHK